jgi:hypothetical protein
MQHVKLLSAIILSACLLFACSCNNPSNIDKKNNAIQAPANDSAPTANSSTATQDSSNQALDTTVKSGDTSASMPNQATDSMLSQLKGLTSVLGKNDSGIINNIAPGSNMDSMMQKMQSMMGGKTGNMGDGIANSLLDLQLGQLSKDNPLKSVANGMRAAQQNGTAGPSKTYTAAYTDKQPADYNMPVSGNGNTIMLQYTGGSIANNKKDGLWKNMYINTKKEATWNVYSDAYAESSTINMKVHVTSLASTNENYNIIINDQYKKFSKQPKSDLGKYEFDVQVQKMGSEKMFGYNCVHVKISYTVKALGQTAHEQNDEWYSADVPGAQFLSPQIFENHSPAVVKKIIDAGCSGLLVKSVIKSSGSFQQVQLSRIAQKDMPDSMFTLPTNYKEDKNTALYGMQ